MNRRLAVEFGPGTRCISADPAAEVPLKLGLPDWTGDVNFGNLQRKLLRLGLQPSEIGLDLFAVALGVYAADLCSSRSTFGDDAWTRHLDVDVEVSDVSTWINAGGILAKGLRFLSNDVWRFRFRPRQLSREDLGFAAPQRAEFRPEVISLFSGGLDSTIGAIDLLRDGHAVLLVSTAGERQTSGPQNDVFRALKENFLNSVVERVHQSVRIPSALKRYGENSQRARSFLFIGFAALIASCYGDTGMPLNIAENGLIALNVPTRPNRVASNSTKTTHPFFLWRMRDMLQVLKIRMEIREPYRFLTKGEMIAASDANALSVLMPLTVSCAKAAQLFHQRTGLLHCGSCTACIIRRAAIASGWHGQDPTPGYFFAPNLDGELIEADKSRGGDIRAFKGAASKLASNPSRAMVDIYRSGPMSDVRGLVDQYADVYARGLTEVGDLLANVATKGI